MRLTRADKNNNSSSIHKIDDGKRSQYQSRQRRNAPECKCENDLRQWDSVFDAVNKWTNNTCDDA